MSEPDEQNPLILRNLILVFGPLGGGGIETLIVRVANFYATRGVKVMVCCKPGGEYTPLLDSQVKVVTYLNTKELVTSVNIQKSDYFNLGEIVILSFDSISAAKAMMLEFEISKFRKTVHLSGIFHPRAYFMDGERADRVFLNYLLARAIGFDRLFFMNEECRIAHSKKWNIDLSGCRIIPLPINIVESNWISSDKKDLRIVSVGRLVDFKAYNIGAVDIIKVCLNQGIHVIWDIYGDGPLHNMINSKIKDCNLEGKLNLNGRLDYSDFSRVVSGYDLFIGMGTAALESAAAGVPTICAVDNELTKCYGYIYELPFGNVGEALCSPPEIEISELIRKYSDSDNLMRTSISNICKESISLYGMQQFSDGLLEMAMNPGRSSKSFKKKIIVKWYYFNTESVVAKFAREVKQLLSKKKI